MILSVICKVNLKISIINETQANANKYITGMFHKEL